MMIDGWIIERYRIIEYVPLVLGRQVRVSLN